MVKFQIDWFTIQSLMPQTSQRYPLCLMIIAFACSITLSIIKVSDLIVNSVFNTVITISVSVTFSVFHNYKLLNFDMSCYPFIIMTSAARMIAEFTPPFFERDFLSTKQTKLWDLLHISQWFLVLRISRCSLRICLVFANILICSACDLSISRAYLCPTYYT